MFSDELEKISWEETTKAIYSKTEADVIRALGKSRCDVDDFMALISPAAEKYLEPMARLSKKYTEERFGRTMSMFIPLYITNSCTNSCVYCGFHISNPMARTILTPEEIENEYKAIKKLGPFENLLIVTGENPAKAGVPYIAKALDLAKPYFSNLKIEVMPLKTEEYAELVVVHARNPPVDCRYQGLRLFGTGLLVVLVRLYRAFLRNVEHVCARSACETGRESKNQIYLFHVIIH